MVAEQIAWTKAKSERIGLRLPMTDEAAALLQSEQRLRLRSPRRAAGRNGTASRRPGSPPCSTTTAATVQTCERCAKRRCCARRWSRATAWSAC